jgi:hypothetical protein
MSVTRIEDIRAKLGNGVEVTLPGWDEEPFIARLKRVAILDLATRGLIPNALLGIASQMFNANNKSNSDIDITQMSKLVDVFVKNSLVEPTYEEVSEYLTDEQRFAIFNYCQKGVKELEPFRTEPKGIELNIDKPEV